MNKLESALEALIFQGRWLLAPFFVGLLVAILVLLVKFMKSLWHMVTTAFEASSSETIINILTLVDTALLASLLLIIIFSGYESFVSRMMNIKDHEDKPNWIGKVGFGGLKLKLISAIVAISAVELLKVFINSHQLEEGQLFWKVMIHLTFVVSGVLFAFTDYIAEKSKNSS